MTVKHATAGAFVFHQFPDRWWRLGLIEHPRLGRSMIPGGHVEEYETPAEAALREVREETGLRDLRLLEPPAPALPGGFPLKRVTQPWWITEVAVSPDNHLAEPHVHVDHQYVAIADSADPSEEAAHPFAWRSAAELAELELWEDTKLLAKALFADIADLSVRREPKPPSGSQ
jgi:8-oxo-dGTP pyrophosphatase MutT (NUDIX family)